jgi:signal transduction histidine kinase/HPt (histidine-containing phosphotransfer) domain-containing protein
MAENNDRNKRILVIDDNKSIHNDFREILVAQSIDKSALEKSKTAILGEASDSKNREFFEVDSAYQGAEGLDKVKQALTEGRPYAMAFVDIRMPPGWDGIETIRHIWAEYPDLQVVICTAYSDYQWHEIVEQLGKTDQLLILKKPFDNVEVRQLACAMTEKWFLYQQAQLKQQELEQKVQQRTGELASTNESLTNEVAERKRAEDQLKQANRQLQVAIDRSNLMAQEALAANKTKGQFLANMSHEIRTPMNAIIGFAEVLVKEDLTEMQKKHVNMVLNSAKNLLDIINDILDFSKIEAGKLETEMLDCSLSEVLVHIDSILRPLALTKGLEFEIVPCTDLPATIHTDSVRMRQCLINLVNNAIKFTEKGHVYMNISIENQDNVPYIRFDVEDTGIGIKAENQQRIFESFAQADNSTTRKFGGTGLGLAITKQLTGLLGGKLSVTSEVGKGSVFTLTIPANIDVRNQPSLDRYNLSGLFGENQKEAEPARFSGRILVAEDAKTNQALIKLVLEQLGLEVIIAEDGAEAVDKALDQSFNLIFMDMQMPNMNGYEATAMLRNKGIAVPIVALTAHAMNEDAEKCINAGCDDYMSKPIDRARLIHILNKYLTAPTEDATDSADSVNLQADKPGESRSEEPSEIQPDEATEEQQNQCPIDWEQVVKICGDEVIVVEISKTFLKDGPQNVDSLVEAIRNNRPKDVLLFAHKLRGVALNIAAVQLAQKAELMELAGQEEDMKTAEALLQDVQNEFTRLVSFLSQPSWTETAKHTAAKNRISQ